MKKQKTIFEINFSSLATLLLVLFIGLKLCNVIAWNWWWVLSPLWLPWVLLTFAWLIITIMSFLLLRGRNKYVTNLDNENKVK